MKRINKEKVVKGMRYEFIDGFLINSMAIGSLVLDGHSLCDGWLRLSVMKYITIYCSWVGGKRENGT